MRSLRYLAAFYLLCALFSVLAFGQSQTSTVVGQVRIQGRGFPDHRIQIHIATRGILMTDAWADEEGRFSFPSLPTNAYTVTIDDPEFEPLSSTFAVDPTRSKTVFLNLILTPKRRSNVDPETPKGSNPNMVDYGSRMKDFPRDAVKAFDEGVRRLEKGKLEEAAEKFRRAIEIAPGCYPARNNLGMIYVQQQKFLAAEHEFQEVIRVQQADANAYFNLGNVYLLTGRGTESQSAIQEGLKREPNSAFGQFLLGTLFARVGNVQEAERQLNRALENDPTMSKVYLELANLYIRIKSNDRALAQLDTFVARFPDDPMIPQAKKVRDRLRAEPLHFRGGTY